MPNEYRKVIARGFARLLDEQAGRTMKSYQSAFLKHRTISSANVQLGEGYYRALDRNELRFWLLLDCAKGYNYLSWQWLERVLDKAGLCDGLRMALRRMVQDNNAVILVFLSHTCAAQRLHSGLAQGDPLSCILYVLAVDPFLEYVAEHIDGVGIVVGFCDDWSAECSTTQCLQEVQRAGDEFELCSGQQFNRCKSKVLPTKGLQDADIAAVRTHWPDCPVVSRAKVLGLWYGYDITAAEVGDEVETKYGERLRILSSLPASMGCRIMLLNIFQRSMWSYLGRHMMIAQPVRQRIERQDLSHVCPVTYFTLGFLSHLQRIYGIRVHLQDFQLANVAGLIATAWLIESQDGQAAVHIRDAVRQSDNSRRHFLRPSTAFATAYAFYFHTVGCTVSATLEAARERRRDFELDAVFSLLYKNLVDADAAGWDRYWDGRLEQRGLDPTEIRRTLKMLPASTPQAARWELMKMHLNAIPTASRLRFMAHVDGAEACSLCGAGVDSLMHVFEDCTFVQQLKRRLSLRQGLQFPTNFKGHCLERLRGSEDVEHVLKLNGAILRVRELARKHAFHGWMDRMRHGELLFHNPGLRGARRGGERGRRREGQELPNRDGRILYRAAGAVVFQGQLRSRRLAGCGCVLLAWQTDEHRPTLKTAQYLGTTTSSNEAEYRGILCATDHARRSGLLRGARVCIQNHSSVAVNQINCVWACRSELLRPLLAAIWADVRMLEQQGVEVSFDLVDRRHNLDAAGLGRRAAREQLRFNMQWAQV